MTSASHNCDGDTELGGGPGALPAWGHPLRSDFWRPQEEWDMLALSVQKAGIWGKLIIYIRQGESLVMFFSSENIC